MGRTPARMELISSATCYGKHATNSFDLQCLKPSVYDCVAGQIPVSERLNQHYLLCLYSIPVIDFAIAKTANNALLTGTVRPPCSCLHPSPPRVFADRPGCGRAYRLQSESDSDRSCRVTATSYQCRRFKSYGNRNTDSMPTCSHIKDVKIVKGISS